MDRAQPILRAVSESPMIAQPACALFRRALRVRGMKYTGERARILAAVLSFSAPFNTEALLVRLRRDADNAHERASKATVYRTLRLLASCGLLGRVAPFSTGGSDAPGQRGPKLDEGDHAYYMVQDAFSAETILVHNARTGGVMRVEAPGLRKLCEDACAKAGLTLTDLRTQATAAG